MTCRNCKYFGIVYKKSDKLPGCFNYSRGQGLLTEEQVKQAKDCIYFGQAKPKRWGSTRVREVPTQREPETGAIVHTES
jgi:hypothetical protein